ncbi:hypothetical protein ABZX77_30930 [Streptomyces sp. NPDC004237]|uniref:hypothetical protein n=1 Tax=Streptomyces sp. NPDC004237 TaxID=3154455 RepID=UPI0033A0E69E
MSDKQRIDALETKVSTLETGLKSKADKSSTITTGEVRTGVLKKDPEGTSELATRSYVEEKTAPASVLKTIQDADLLGGSKFSVASIAMGSFISIGLGTALAATLPSFFSTSDILTKWLENKFHVIRRNNGFLWKESTEQRERRLRQESARDNFGALRRTVDQLETRQAAQAGRIRQTNISLGETNARLATVRNDVRTLSGRSTDIRNRAQGAASMATTSGVTDDLQLLRRQVDMLVTALG